MNWQPLETAPKDVEALLLYVVMPPGSEYAKAVGMPEGWSEVDVGEWSSQRRQWESVRIAGTPTHWMPLPEPPQ